MSTTVSLHNALQSFAASVTEKSNQFVAGEPEEQLRAPFERFMHEAATGLGCDIVCTGEAPLPDRLGRPDYAIHLNQLLAGYVELKAPGVGADARRFRGRNREQFKRFSSVPNILYTDGNEWALYRNGEQVDKIVRLSGDIVTEGSSAVTSDAAGTVQRLLNDFLQWNPYIPVDRAGNVELKGFAELLAPLCRMLRDDVSDALKDAASPLVHLAEDWRQLLFPDASDNQFADAYAQTVAFALLLGRSEGADPLTLESAEKILNVQHNLLSRALRILTDDGARSDIAASLDLLLRVIAVVPPVTFAGPGDPWLYFYEDFLAAYDPKLRKDAGVYYTPVEVVHAQVRLIDDLLVSRLGREMGFADPDVVTLDPAVGTGTYLLGVIEHTVARIRNNQGKGAIPGVATTLARNLYGFEQMVGPYAVAELRVSRAIADQGALLPPDGMHIHLTDTLESPHTIPAELPLYLRPISEQHRKALDVKNGVPVMVCLGNPPYDRHEAATKDNKARTGHWVRWGDGNDRADPILRVFIDPVLAAGRGGDLKNLYNLYVYFWRWALWKVFEHENAYGPGVVSFISASSYIHGDAFGGMRAHLRQQCDEVWILDLGGEGRGTRQSENVFDIKIPVAIAVAFRANAICKNKPAAVHYARIDGTHKEKLAVLDGIDSFTNIQWEECPQDWQAPFRPAGKGDYFAWPLLTDLMPRQLSGVKSGRTWVISPQKGNLDARWRTLMQTDKEKRKGLFKDSPTGRKAHRPAIQLPPSDIDLQPIVDLENGYPTPNIVRFSYRSFDRQFIFGDARLLDRPGPALWRAHNERQVYLTSLLKHPLGKGPAFTTCAYIPDAHHFRGSYGGKDVFPLYHSIDAAHPNILPGLLDQLGRAYGHNVTPEDFLAYLYGAAAQPAFTARFAVELETRELRIPLTRDATLFEKARSTGARLIWLHTYGERFVPGDAAYKHTPCGVAKCIKAVPGNADGYPETFSYNDTTRTLHVGEGTFAPVTPEVYEFEVSGLQVVRSWLKYRMKKGAGKKSSPLDDIRPESWTSQFTTELLELLWVLEETVNGYPAQEELLDLIVEGDCFKADDFPMAPERMRNLKGAGTHGSLL